MRRREVTIRSPPRPMPGSVLAGDGSNNRERERFTADTTLLTLRPLSLTCFSPILNARNSCLLSMAVSALPQMSSKSVRQLHALDPVVFVPSDLEILLEYVKQITNTLRLKQIAFEHCGRGISCSPQDGHLSTLATCGIHP